MSNLPKSTETTPARKKSGCLKIALLTVLVLLVVLHFTASFIAKGVANKQLPKQLQTDASVGYIDISLLLGRVGIRNLQIAQPEGFEGDDMVHLEKLVVAVPPGKAIKHNPLEVRNVHLDGLKLNFISDTNGIYNFTQIGPPPKNEPETEEVEAAEPAEPMPLLIKDILLENIQLNFKDLAKDWEFIMQDIRLEVSNIQMEYDSGDGPALIQLDVLFPGGDAVGKLKVIAKVGSLLPSDPERVPPVQLAVALVGFDLDLLTPFLVPNPTVAKTAFGGDGFDLLIFFNLGAGESPDTQEIDGFFELATNKGQKTDDKLSGSLAEPNLPFTTLFADILGNQFGRITKLGSNVAKGGLEAGKAVAGTGVAAVKGAGKTVAGFAGGVLRTAKGVVTLDTEDTLGGMKDATVGTIGDLTDTVTDTASAAGEGISNTTGAVTGSTQRGIWWSEVDTRMTAFEKQAAEWFEKNPFPVSGN